MSICVPLIELNRSETKIPFSEALNGIDERLINGEIETIFKFKFLILHFTFIVVYLR